MERSWDVPGKSITPNLAPRLSHASEILGKTVTATCPSYRWRCRGSAAASPSPHSQSGAGSSVKPSQPNSSTSSLVKNPEPSSSTGGPPTAPLSSSNNKSIPNGPDGKASTTATTQVQTNGAATLFKSAVCAAIVETAHAHPNGNSLLATKDRNEFVRDVLTLIYVCPAPLFICGVFIHFPWFDSID